jgi:hypothetical protein
MNDDHITYILDNSPLTQLSEVELRTVRAHVEGCDGCAQAFEAAQLWALVIRERASEAREAAANFNPFFQTRVLAAWREQQAANRVPAFRRLWNATAALVASMAATTAALAVLTFVAPSSNTTNQPTAAVVPYSAETVVLDQDQDDNSMTDDQVINAVYVDDDEGK